MDINFEYYKIFYYVAKYCNFTKAARALGNSQPNVTRAMNNLEQQINSILFIRNNRGVQLTPEGERLYSACICSDVTDTCGGGGAVRQHRTVTRKRINRSQ